MWQEGDGALIQKRERRMHQPSSWEADLDGSQSRVHEKLGAAGGVSPKRQ